MYVCISKIRFSG